MNPEFEAYKEQIENELGRPFDQGEEIILKAYYYFGKGLQMLKVLRIGEIKNA